MTPRDLARQAKEHLEDVRTSPTSRAILCLADAVELVARAQRDLEWGAEVEDAKPRPEEAEAPEEEVPWGLYVHLAPHGEDAAGGIDGCFVETVPVVAVPSGKKSAVRVVFGVNAVATHCQEPLVLGPQPDGRLPWRWTSLLVRLVWETEIGYRRLENECPQVATLPAGGHCRLDVDLLIPASLPEPWPPIVRMEVTGELQVGPRLFPLREARYMPLRRA